MLDRTSLAVIWVIGLVLCLSAAIVSVPAAALAQSQSRRQMVAPRVPPVPKGTAAATKPSPAPAMKPLQVKETVLGTLPPDGLPQTLSASPDRQHWAYAIGKEPGHCAWVIDGVRQKEYPIIEMISWSPQGNRTFYIAATIPPAQKVWAVVDGAEGPQYDGWLAKSLLWSADGQHYLFWAYKGDEKVAITDGKESRPYAPSVYIGGEPEVSRQGWCWMAVQGRNGKQFVVVNGEDGEEYDAIQEKSLRMSEDGKHWGYVGMRENGTKKAYFVAVDDKAYGPYDGVSTSLLFSGNSEHWAFSARNGPRSFLMIDGKEVEILGKYTHGGPVLSPDGKHLVYNIVDEVNYSIVRDGKPGKPFPCNGVYPIFSPDSQHLACIKIVGPRKDPDAQKWQVELDGKDHPAFEEIFLEGPQFSSDSQHFAYIASEDLKSKVVVLDGKKGKTYPDAHTLIFSPDGKRLAYTVQVGKTAFRRVIDGVEGPIGQQVYWSNFGPDSRHIAYVVLFKDNDCAVIADGMQSPHYDRIAGGHVAYDAPDRFQFIAMRGMEILRVEVKLP